MNYFHSKLSKLKARKSGWIYFIFIVLVSAVIFVGVRGTASASGNHTAEVTNWYWVCLGRAPDSGGLNYWVGQLNNGDNHNGTFATFVNAAGCPKPQPSCSFTASSYSITPGQNVTFNWSTSYGQYIGIDPNTNGIFNSLSPASSGSRTVKPTASGPYTFLVTNPNGSRSCPINININYGFSGTARPNRDCLSGTANTLLHARDSWLTSGSSSIPQGTNSVSLRLNARGEVCEGYNRVNVSSDGGVVNKNVDGDSEYIVNATVASNPSIPGLSLTNLSGQSAVISRAGQYGSGRPVQAFTPVFSSGYGTLSGLAGLSPGSYTITVSANVVGTAFFPSGRVCVSPAGKPANGIGDTASCNITPKTYTFTITVTGGSPGLSCTTYGPNPSIIDKGDSSSFGWSTTAVSSVVLRNSINTDETTVPWNNPSYSVSPDQTTTYYIVAKDGGGSERPCSVTVQVRSPQVNPPNAFECKPILYQILNTDLTRFNPDNGQYDPIGPTGVSNVNGAGYNPIDNYMYASIIDNAGVGIGRIDNTGKATRIPMKLKGTNQDIDKSSVVGDFDSSGNLWLLVAPSVVYKVDVSAGTYEVLNLSNSINGVNDWVYISGSFYGMYSTGYLVRVNATTLQVTASATQVAPSGSVYGAAWTNISNKLYVGRNDPGELYDITGYTGNNPTSKKIFDTTTTFGNDGASCPTAKDPLAKINYPFLRVNGSDVIAGAKFSSGDVCSDPIISNTLGTIETNGFKKHGYSQTETGDILSGSSSAQYGAFALSKIDSLGDTSSFLTNDGYYRNLGPSNNYARDLMFANATANQPPMEYGNFNTINSLPCLNISQIERSSTAANSTEIINALKTGSDTQILKMSTGNLDISGPQIIIPKDKKLTIIVDNSVNIRTNIIYASSSSLDGAISSPQLTIIAKNGITIWDSVTQLDGYYDAHNSTLKTCDNNELPSTRVCNKQLIINGGLTGKKIEWRRNYGTLGPNLTTIALPDNSRCAVESLANGDVAKVISAQNSCAAERVDFNPLFYFNNPFSTKPSSTAISGAPLNSVELPPIY